MIFLLPEIRSQLLLPPSYTALGASSLDAAGISEMIETHQAASCIQNVDEEKPKTIGLRIEVPTDPQDLSSLNPPKMDRNVASCINYSQLLAI